MGSIRDSQKCFEALSCSSPFPLLVPKRTFLFPPSSTLLAGVIFSTFHPTSQPTDYVTREGCCFDGKELNRPKGLDEELVKYWTD